MQTLLTLITTSIFLFIFCVLTHGAWLIASDKQKEYEKRKKANFKEKKCLLDTTISTLQKEKN